MEEELAKILEEKDIDLVMAGPGFNAGRYGMACGGVCKIAFEKEIIAISALNEENPGLEIYKKYGYIFPTSTKASDMKNACWREKSGAEIAVDMALAKALGQPFTTEVEMPKFDHIVPSAPVEDLSKVKVAILTSGGMVPVGNPDHLEALSASRWCSYNIDDFGGKAADFKGEVAHGGYDPVYGNDDGNRILHYDAFKELEKRGVIGELYDKMLVTVGNCMDVAKATRYGKEMAQRLKDAGVQADLLTST